MIGGRVAARRAAPAHPEADFQRQLVKDLRAILTRPFRVAAVPNEIRQGGKAGRIAQGIALGMGVDPGFADLLIMQGGRMLFLECKSKDGRLSADQKGFRDFALAEGHGWAMVRTLDDALAAIAKFNFKTRIKPNGTA